MLAAGATAVVAFNDEIAAGLLNRFADRGVRVPDDVSVVGHDDTALAETVTPRLTTVHIPAAAAGAAAAQMLVRHLVGRLGDDERRPPHGAVRRIDRPRRVPDPRRADATPDERPRPDSVRPRTLRRSESHKPRAIPHIRPRASPDIDSDLRRPPLFA